MGGISDAASYVINDAATKKLYATMKNRQPATEPRDLGREWHSDCKPDAITLTDVTDSTGLFEECPADFSFLRMEQTPPAGGDTLWVSGYELQVPWQTTG